MKSYIFPLVFLAFAGILATNAPEVAPKQTEKLDYNVYQPCWEKKSGETEWRNICDKPAVEVKKEEPKISTPQPNVGEGVEQWRELVSKYFPANEVNKILQVMQGESGGNPNAEGHNRNGSFDRGLMQVNSIHSAKVDGDLDSLFDPETNIRIASQIWNDSGYGAWTVARRLGF